MKWTNLWMLLLALATPVSALDAGLLIGTLRHSETADSIAGANVRIMAVNVEREFNTVTDDKGRFAYAGLPRGTYLVTVAKEGYATIDVFDLLIEQGETTRLNLTMTPTERAPVKRQLIRYRRPLINTEDASIKYVFRTGA